MTNLETIRECDIDDAENVLTLWRQADTSVSVTDSVVDIRAAIGNDASIVLAAEQDERIVGSIIGGFDGWRGNIYRLAVHPDYQRRGIALRLLTEVENRLAQIGVKRITALVEKDHSWATGYWNAVGYQLDFRMVRYVRNL